MLSACSPYFEAIFKTHEVDHPVVILKGISRKEMKCLIDYMYVGSLEVSEDELPSLLAVANELQIKGELCGTYPLMYRQLGLHRRRRLKRGELLNT